MTVFLDEKPRWRRLSGMALGLAMGSVASVIGHALAFPFISNSLQHDSEIAMKHFYAPWLGWSPPTLVAVASLATVVVLMCAGVLAQRKPLIPTLEDAGKARAAMFVALGVAFLSVCACLSMQWLWLANLVD